MLLVHTSVARVLTINTKVWHSSSCQHLLQMAAALDKRGQLTMLCRTAWIAGLIQTATYADFFYYYFKAWRNNEKLALPV